MKRKRNTYLRLLIQTLTCVHLSILAYSKRILPARNQMTSNEFGSNQQFKCSSLFQDLNLYNGNLQMNNIALSNIKQKSTNNKIQFCQKPNKSGSAFYKDQVNIRNGFRVSFTVRQLTQQFEGFAVVVQSESIFPMGQNKDGLGYAGIGASMAIEFDFKHSKSKNDPISKRHVSVIVSKNNMAHETSSIGWNDQLDNINNKNDENYLKNAKVVIEYINLQLFVTINDNPVLSIYEPIDLNKMLGFKNNYAYIGFTCACGKKSYRQKLKDVRIQLAMPDLNKTSLKSIPYEKQTLSNKDNLYFDLTFVSKCNTHFKPSLPFQNKKFIKVSSDHDCNLSQFFIPGKNVDYRFSVKCKQAGINKFNITYQNTFLKEYKAIHLSKKVDIMNIDIPMTSTKQKKIQLSVKYTNKNGTDSKIYIYKIKKEFKINLEDEEIDFSIKRSGVASVLITFTYSQAGTYKFSQQNLQLKGKKQISTFPVLNKQISYLSITDNNHTLLTTNKLQINQLYYIKTYLQDTNGNSMDNLTITYKLKYNSIISGLKTDNKGAFNLTKIGKYSINNSHNIKCQNCYFTVANDNSPIILANTKIVDTHMKDVNQLPTGKGQPSFNLLFQDAYHNQKTIDKQAIVNVSLPADNLQLCTLNLKQTQVYPCTNNTQYNISVGDQHINVTMNGQSVELPIKFIRNNASDYDSASQEVDYYNSTIEDKYVYLVKCNDSSVFDIKLKTSDGLVHNQSIDFENRLQIVNMNEQIVQYSYQILYTSQINELAVVIRQLTNCAYTNTSHLKVTIDDNLIGNIQVRHFNEQEAVQSSVLVTQLPQTMLTYEEAYISLKLYNQTNYPLMGQKIANRLKAIKIQGHCKDVRFVFDPNTNQFNARVVPIYTQNGPILELKFQIFNLKSKLNEDLKINHVTTIIKQQLDLDKTQYKQNAKFTYQITKPIAFNFVLHGKLGDCYEKQVGIEIQISKITYIDKQKQELTNNIDQNDLIKNEKFNETSIFPIYSKLNLTKSCTNNYLAVIDQNLFKIKGNYLIKFFSRQLDDEYLKYDKQSQGYNKVMEMKAGPICLNKTKFSIVGQIGSEVQFTSEQNFQFNITFYDKYENSIEEIGTPFFVLGVNRTINKNKQKLTKIGIIKVQKKGKVAEILVKVQVKKVGKLKGLTLTLHGQSILLDDADDLPDSIVIIPGKISYDKIQIFGLNIATLVGYKNIVYIQTQDQYRNNLIKYSNSNKFTAEVIGTYEGKVINKITLNLNKKRYKNKKKKIFGRYSFHYKTSWEGEFQMKIKLNGKPYTTLNQSSIFKKCTQSHPAMCSNSNTCETSYIHCNLTNTNPTICGTNQEQFYCKVNNISTCVSSITECDCESPMEFKCIYNNNACMWKDRCNNMYRPHPCNQYQCPDGSCRLSAANCPSLKVCPPGYKMCPNYVCISKDFLCEESFKITPNTPITCTNPSHVVCPDNTCVSSEWLCQAPQDLCKPNEYTCSDYSCQTESSKCPSQIQCPPQQSLCENHICSTDCSSINTTSLLTYLNPFTSPPPSPSSSPSPGNPPSLQIVCPDGSLALDISHCGTPIYCESPLVRCADFSCQESLNACVQTTCSFSQFKCDDGRCVSNNQECGTMVSCPVSMIRCPDGRCINSLKTSCLSTLALARACPTYRPYRCSNGECHQSSFQCSSSIQCPPIKPIKCNDNQCVKSKHHCLLIIKLYVISKGHVICPDGHQAVSLMMCPSIKTCAPGQVHCWDNTCHKNRNECPEMNDDFEPTTCNDPLAPYRCPDGSCSSRMTNCPTQVICPEDRYILCSDGNCRSSIDQCETETNCPHEMIQCPSGACVKKNENCGTQITCSTQSPYKCWDQTCGRNPLDCPKMHECTNPLSRIQCPDGSCVRSRELCKEIISEKCVISGYVKCPNLQCKKDTNQCQKLDGMCPIGLVLCSDNTCRSHQDLCIHIKCPVFMSHQCTNGQCVTHKKYCDRSNGCPYHTPERCQSDGQCVTTLLQCRIFKQAICGQQALCPDGSCRERIELCPNESGCPLEKPLLCVSGRCIDPKKSSCAVGSCSIDRPVRCPDGLCVLTITHCSYSPQNQLGVNSCSGLVEPSVMCAGGRCAPMLLMCPPILQCVKGSKRCHDGSCRILERFCPQMATVCPPHKSYMCLEGSCAKDKNSCLEDNGCLPAYPIKCESNGLCVKPGEQCNKVQSAKPPIENNLNNFRMKEFLKYKHNRKLTRLLRQLIKQFKEIKLYNYYSQLYQLYYVYLKDKSKKQMVKQMQIEVNDSLYQKMMKMGKLLQKLWETQQNFFVKLELQQKKQMDQLKNEILEIQKCKYLCPNLQKCEEHWEDCKTLNGCPTSQPILCSISEDGHHHCSASLLSDDPINGCKPIVSCPAQNPIRCNDGSCVSSDLFCKTGSPCADGYTLCAHTKTCVKHQKDCSRKVCPQATPIMCPETALCVTDQVQCLQQSQVYCPNLLPHKCSTGLCVAFRSECELTIQSQNSKIVPIQLDTDILKTVMQFNETKITTKPQGSIQQKQPSSSSSSTSSSTSTRQLSESSKCPYLCSDGSCKQSSNNCITSLGCTTPLLPYLCPSGNCASSLSNCLLSPIQCPSTLTSCEDGLCRTHCPVFNGCPKHKPLHCLAGGCASDHHECAGYEMCPLNTPYRNKANLCGDSLQQLDSFKRETKFNKLLVDVYPLQKIVVPFLYPKDSIKNLASLSLTHTNIHSNVTSETTQYQLTLQQMPDSVAVDYSVLLNNSQYLSSVKQFPAIHDQMLSWQAVRSTAISISYPVTDASKHLNIYLTIAYDRLNDTHPTLDYCLGKYHQDTKRIICDSDQGYAHDYSASNSALTFSFSSPGSYSVIYYPQSPPQTPNRQCLFLCQNYVKLIKISILSLLIGTLIIYCCYKLVTLFSKLKQAKQREKNYKNHLDYVLGLQGSQVQGEGVKDMQLGLLFKKNPAYQAASSNIQDVKKQINALNEKLVSMKERELDLQADNNELREINQNLVTNQQQREPSDQQQFEESNLLLDEQFTS